MKKNNSQVDFNEQLLPPTRKKQGLEIISMHWKKLGLIGLLFAAFGIPLIMCHVSIPAARETIYQTLIQQGKTEEQIIGVLSFNTFISDCVAVLAYLLLSVAFAGSVSSVRGIVYNEGILFKEDYIKGIKMYYKPFLITFGIYGLTRAILKGIDLLTINSTDIKISILIGIVTAIFYVIIVPIMYIYLSYNVFYTDSFITKVVNCFKIYVSNILGLLMFIPWLLILYYLLPLIPQFAIRIVVELFILIIFCPLFVLLFHLFMVHISDETINIHQFPEMYRKGLSKNNK